MKPKVIAILEEGKKSLESEIQQVDLVIESAITAHGRDNEAVGILLQGRARLQLQIDLLSQTISRVRNAADGKLADPEASKQVIPGQYTGMKVSIAVQAYLSDRGRGPVSCSKIVEDLNLAGVRVEQSRSKYHRGEARELNTRDLRLLAANNTKRFVYDSMADSLAMTTATGNDTGWKRQRKPRGGGALVPAAG